MPVTPVVEPAPDGAPATAAVTMAGPLYRFLRGLTRLICRVYFRLSISGAEHIPAEGPVILAPVHRSFMDFLVAAQATRRMVHFMAKDDLWKSKLLGRFLQAGGAFPVNRAGTDRVAIERSQAVLERGDVLIVFPEGTRRAGTAVEDLHEGAAFLAARTGAPIVPIGIGGTSDAMPKGSKMVRPVKVAMVVAAPVPAPPRSERGRVPRHQVHAATEALTVALQAAYDDARRRAGR
ncbi:MAG: lysophospholipid acyltransferase family protein [Acidimicrobiales bacterium]